MTSWLILILLGGTTTDAVEIPTAQCLRIVRDVETSEASYATDDSGRKERVLEAICRPWPPLDPCDCDGEVPTQ